MHIIKGVRILNKDIKVRLAQLDKKQTDLLDEVRKEGYPRLTQTAFCAYINGRIGGPQAEVVLEIARGILDIWERKKGA